jgi:hypothetical protein
MEEMDFAVEEEIAKKPNNKVYEESHAHSHVESSVIEKEKICKVDWFVQAQQRQQALTGLQSLCKQWNEENTEMFSEESFCRLFSQVVSPQYSYTIFKDDITITDFVIPLKERSAFSVSVV